MFEAVQIGDDSRQRGGDDRLVERGQQRGEHDAAERDEDRGVRASGDPLTVVVFDLDGTLVATGPDIAAAVNRVRADYDLDPLPEDEIVGQTGLGAETLIERAVGRD